MPRPSRSQHVDSATFQAAFDAWHTKIHTFSDEVEARVKEQYGLEDGGDLCYNLLDNDVIPEDASVDEAARIVAQHMEQA